MTAKSRIFVRHLKSLRKNLLKKEEQSKKKPPPTTGKMLGGTVDQSLAWCIMYKELKMTGLKQNRKKWERVAKKLLDSEKQESSPYYLYSLQLLQWVLEKHELVGHWAKYQDVFQERIMRMFGWNPDNVQKVLLKNFSADEKEQKSASKFGMLLLENLDASLNLY